MTDEYRRLSASATYALLGDLMHDLFRWSMAAQDRDDTTTAMQLAMQFFAVATVLRNAGQPYPEPFASRSLSALALERRIAQQGPSAATDEGERDWPGQTGEGSWLV